jgi:hypothetical protein
VAPTLIVIPEKAGMHLLLLATWFTLRSWIPAYAGMTGFLWGRACICGAAPYSMSRGYTYR